MKSEVRIDSEDSGVLEDIVKPSLQAEGRVKVDVDSTSNELVTQIDTDSLGALRGSTDNVFRLTSLAKKIYET